MNTSAVLRWLHGFTRSAVQALADSSALTFPYSPRLMSHNPFAGTTIHLELNRLMTTRNAQETTPAIASGPITPLTVNASLPPATSIPSDNASTSPPSLPTETAHTFASSTSPDNAPASISSIPTEITPTFASSLPTDNFSISTPSILPEISPTFASSISSDNSPVFASSILPEISSISPTPTLTIRASSSGNNPPGKRVNTWGLQQIKAPEAWPYTTGRSIKIGVIDTGVDHTHPDIKDAIAGGVNLLQKGTPPTDDNGHGTHICGIIAANNTLGGMAGVAPHARLYPVKAFDADGSAFVSDIILGIEWCVRNKMDIINMSFGMKTRSKALLNAVGAAYQAGIPIIASSGNDAKPRTIDYPARYQQTISVGATNRYHQVAHFCNRGPYINIYAPGERIVSTWLNGAYHEMNGTSMATAHVTGAVALMLAFHPNLSIAEIKQILQESMSPLRGVRNGMQPYFVGELNIPLMMQALRGRYPKSSAD